jgi:hypothetical protein
MSMHPPAGWFPDPQDQDQFRYWDGNGWTEHQAPRTPAAPAEHPRRPVAAPQASGGTTARRAPTPPDATQGAPRKNWFLRHKVLSVVLAVVVILIIAGIAGGGGSSGDSSPSATDTPSSSPSQSPSSAPSVKATKSPKPKPQVPSYADGTYRIGRDIKPGTYRSSVRGTCYWATLRGFGGNISDIIQNGNNSPAIVTLVRTDRGFQTQGCGDWKNVASTFPATPASKFGDGAFIVGEDIKPGTYRSPGSGSCYWARMSSFAGGGVGGIIANGNSPGIVTISANDRGFQTYGCGTWAH